MKTRHQRAVEEFMRKAQQDVPTKPCIPSDEVRALRARLILEEALETILALGFVVREVPGHLGIQRFEVWRDPTRAPNLVEIADGCADIVVVTTGTAAACGLDLEPLQKLVDAANLSKFGPGHSFREDGKLLKPPDWKHPDLFAEIERQKQTPFVFHDDDMSDDG